MAIDLTCAVLTSAYFLAEAAFADSAKKADYVVEVEAAKAIIENTTAKIDYITDSQKKQTARIYWSKFCNGTVATTEPDFCEITGPEADAACKDYIINQRVNTTFTIDEKNYETSNLNVPEVLGDNMLKSMKAMDEKIAQMIVAKLGTFVTGNLYQEGLGCSDETGDWLTTYINPTYWSPSLYAYFVKTAKLNRFTNAFLLDGSNLFDHIVAAQTNEGNSNGKGNAAYLNMMKTYSDLFNMETIAPGKTYMIERGSVAFANKALWKGVTPQNAMSHGVDGVKYSVPSKNLPGVVYDVYVKKNCSSEFEKLDVLMETRFLTANGAEACNGATGVLEFACGACPAIEPGS
ncbi:MAG: hypothetical protein M3R27_14920 [Bacteroidota bacterium]|nr:hypothetical protein [Bacteroidota bacterium]